MGISDDIVRRHKISTNHSHSHHKMEPEAPIFDNDHAEEIQIESTNENELPEKIQETVETESEKADQETTDQHEDFFGHKIESIEPIKKESKAQKDKKTTDPEKARKLKTALAWIFSFVLLGIALYILITNFQSLRNVLKGNNNKNTTSNTSTTSTPTITPQNYTNNTSTTTPTTSSPTTTTPTTTTTTPTTTPTTLDKSSIKIQVLNGNGITGSASTITAALQKAGFTVSNTGNAKSFTYTKTYVYFKTGQDAAAQAVETALAGRTVIRQNSDTIAKTYDIVVVIGKK